MLYQILWPLHEYFTLFNVFRYITFRTALATLSALLLSLALGNWLIRKLKAMQIGQNIRPEGPSSHASKAGTPTMGGILILAAVFVPVLLWADLTNRFLWVALGSTFLFGVIGFIDDFLKVKRKRSEGLTARGKFLLQVIVAVGIGLVLMHFARQGHFTLELPFPFFKILRPDLGWFFIPFTVLVVVGSANAVNLTDGLDGLATGCVLIAAGAYTILSYIAGHAVLSEYLDVVNVKGSWELTIFCGALVGANLGFLWFNCHPAQVFLGDVGSMALGGAIGTVALLVKQEILLLFVGGLFVIEALSVIIQVGSFRLRGKRVFRMAPLHHHFELLGWAEPKVIIRFWIIAIIFALMALATLKLR